METQPQKQHDRKEQETLQEDNLAARRAAVEAIDVGRETLMVAASQNEQITKANEHADDSQYALEKSSRLLRGMTWSGWIANKFSRDVMHPSQSLSKSGISADDALQKALHSVRDNQEAPQELRPAFQAVQNYRANLLILDQCETDEQRTMCHTVCDTVYDVAVKEIAKVIQIGENDSRQCRPFCDQLASDLSTLRDYQTKTLSKEKTIGSPSSDKQASELKQTFARPESGQSEPKDAATLEQEEHLDFLAENLGELKSIAHSMGNMMTEQNDLLDLVNEKSETIMDKAKLVTRKADKMIQRKAWTSAKKEFQSWVTIQHVATGHYLAVSARTGVIGLVNRFHPDASVFGMWKRQGSAIFGLKHRYTKRWLGQTLLGSLSCSASSFANREEWDSSTGDNENTKLVCACANWGVGGYLILQKDNVLALSGSGAEAKRAADCWCLKEVELS